MEVVTTFLALKLADPDGIFMTRGNHESKNMNKIYGFEGEVRKRCMLYHCLITSMIFLFRGRGKETVFRTSNCICFEGDVQRRYMMCKYFLLSRLRGTQGARPNTTAQVWALAEVLGTCSGGSKSQVTTGRHSEHVEPSRPLQTHVPGTG